MKLTMNRYWLVAASLVLVALLAGCHSGSSKSGGAGLMGGMFQDEEDGLTLTADPSEIVIDLGDPGSPTDPGTGTSAAWGVVQPCDSESAATAPRARIASDFFMSGSPIDPTHRGDGRLVLSPLLLRGRGILHGRREENRARSVLGGLRGIRVR